MVEYKNIIILNYDEFINKLTIICNNYNAQFNVDKICTEKNIYNLYVEDLKTIAGEYIMQDIMNLISYS